MTDFEKVYNSFRGKVRDYDLAVLAEEDENAVLYDHLIFAIVRFTESCPNVADIEQEQFINDLTIEQIDILAVGMVESWSKAKMNNAELMRNFLNTKDFTGYSSANLLSKIADVNQKSHDEFISRIKEYSYIHNDVGDLV